MNYEIVLGLYTGYICSVRGPFPAGAFPDLKIANDKGLVQTLLTTGEKSVADGTYKNRRVFVNGPPKWQQAQSTVQRVAQVAKCRQETVNSRIKRFNIFNCLRGFRHDMKTHGYCFHAIANMTQIELEIDAPLFSIKEALDEFDDHYNHHHRVH